MLEPHKELKGSVEKVEKMIKEHSLDNIHERFTDRLVAFGVAGVGLLAVFAWDIVAKDFFTFIFPDVASAWVHLLYAILLTLVAVVISAQAPTVKAFLAWKKEMKEMKKKE